MSNAQSLLTPGSLGAPTPTNHSAKKFSWERPKLRRDMSAQSAHSEGHRVTFSGSSKGSGKGSGKGSSRESDSGREREYSSQSDNSRPPTPPPSTPVAPRANEPWVTGEDLGRKWQKIDRKGSVAYQEKTPPLSPPPQESRPFLVYNDAFLPVIGAKPSLSCLIHDTRGAFFHNSGIYSHKTSTLFISSAPFPDGTPSMAPSRNLNATISKIDFFSATDHSRDKVRTPDHTYMVKSGCAWKTGIVLCAQGTLKEPAALVFMDSKRPHRHFPLLTNFNGIPLNSPWACIAHADGSLWFSDPHLHHTPNFRPRPRLPPMIYRFDPASSDLRAMCSDIAHPTALAFSPDYKVLYVLDGTPPPTSQSAPVPLATTTPMLYAFTVSCFGSSKAPFLTHKRLFAFTTSPPTSVTTDSKGHVYVGCQDGVHIFDIGGSLIGRIVVEGGATGLCFGRTGELWVSANEKIWRVQLHPSLGGSVPRNHD